MNIRYVIDTTSNGYILSIKTVEGSTYIDKMVFSNLQSLFEEVDKREALEGRIQ